MSDASPTADRHWTPVVLPDLPPPAGAYSPGVRTANLLFVSGQTPRNPATGQIVGETFEEQAKVTLDNLERILRAGGATLADVVSVTVYLADEDDWGKFDAFYRTVFSPPYPTRAVVGAQLRGILVEISAIAAIA
jgi:2-iminobutanoate/2-iminopropanoate deaminase